MSLMQNPNSSPAACVQPASCVFPPDSKVSHFAVEALKKCSLGSSMHPHCTPWQSLNQHWLILIFEQVSMLVRTHKHV